MLPPFPFRGQKLPYRFLDTYGLPSMPGDISRFTAAHVRADAGVALPGVWRPKTATATATLTAEQGCLVVLGATGAAVAVHMAVPADVDVILEILPDYPFRDTNMVYTVGTYLDIATEGRLCAANLQSDTYVVVSEDAVSRNVPVVSLRKGVVDLTDLALTTTQGNYGTIYPDLLGIQPVIFTRFKRSVSAGAFSAYYSLNGYVWKLVHTGAGAVAASSIGIYAHAAGDLGPTPRIRVAGMKFLDPATAFPS